MSAENELVIEEAADSDGVPSKIEPLAAETIAAEKVTIAKPEPDSNHTAPSEARPAPEQVIAWFAACARCSYFLSGYRLENLENSAGSFAAGCESGWLSLRWDQSLCKLVRKSYGCGIDVDCYHYGGACPECQRRFVFHISDDEPAINSFRIELKPRTGR